MSGSLPPANGNVSHSDHHVQAFTHTHAPKGEKDAKKQAGVSKPVMNSNKRGGRDNKTGTTPGGHKKREINKTGGQTASWEDSQ